jgi:hypothetical protein
MSKTKYATLVEQAQQKLQNSRQIVFDSIALEEIARNNTPSNQLAQSLETINQHITVDSKIFSEAAQSYEEIAAHLITELDWSNDDIHIIPQGSCRTKTLIRSPDASKFDIDAVCAVNINRIEANDPMGFFNKIGEALIKWDKEVEAKKRCWCIDFKRQRYYIDFTPSIPLNTIPRQAIPSIRYSPDRYASTALAVVDTPTQTWKTSNPAGFAQWVSDQADRPLLMILALESKSFDSLSHNIESVPEQKVPLTDTLRTAIRLLKRHRDMSVRRGYIESELRPISVIIATLLTQCYEGLADSGKTYTHPLKLFTDLVTLMPFMIEERNGQYWIDNPTVYGENFAERWNVNLKLKKTFDVWCDLLLDDLQSLLLIKDSGFLDDKLKEVFGCTGATDIVSFTPKGLTSKIPSHPHAVPPTRGLA